MPSYENKHRSLSEVEEILRDRKSGQTKLYKNENGKIVVDHVRTANAMSMFIANAPMDRWLKKILLMRLGSPLINRRPMSHLEIALKLGMKEQEVAACEAEGIRICNEFMSRCTGGLVAPDQNKSIIYDTLNETKE